MLEDFFGPILLAREHLVGVETRNIDVKDNMPLVGDFRIFINIHMYWPTTERAFGSSDGLTKLSLAFLPRISSLAPPLHALYS
jgi:hypothetical protein